MSNWDIEDVLGQIQEHYAKENLTRFWTSERNEIRKALEVFGEQQDLKRFSIAPGDSVYGVGGSGIVLKMSDELFGGSHVALKFPRPVNGQINELASMLSKEITRLVKLNHPCIVKIIQYGSFENIGSYSKLPYYIMEGVSGKNSNEYIKSGIVNEYDFITIVSQTISALAYMHTNTCGNLVHMDVKPKNIVIGDNLEPVMIDLGTCKLVNSDKELTHVACTGAYAAPRVVELLDRDPSDDNRSRGDIRRCDISPQWDLHPLGLTLLEWLGLNKNDGSLVEGAIFYELSAYARKFLLLIVSRLLHEEIPLWLSREINIPNDILKYYKIDNTEQLYDIFNRIDGRYGPIFNLDEICGPLHNSIQTGYGQHVRVTDRLKRVLEHRLFRRLNSLTQLGLVYQVYPGAKHTRREHSLGTYSNVIKVIRHLWEDSDSPFFRQIITEENIVDVLLASLLHDIGQFPFAHELEEVDNRLFNHAELTKAILQGRWEKKKKGSRKIEFESLDSVFSDWGTTSDRLLRILNAKPKNQSATPTEKLLRSLISGPIDADKIDYLVRDGRQLNLPYPEGIDLKRIYNNLTTVVVDRVAKVQNVATIGINAKGRSSAEFLSFARYTMFSQAYWHHAVRAQKAMLGRAVLGILNSIGADADLQGFISDFVSFVTSLPECLYRKEHHDMSLFDDKEQDKQVFNMVPAGMGTDLAATDMAVLHWLGTRLVELDQPEGILINGILSRGLFKRLWVVSNDQDSSRWKGIVSQWDQLDRAGKYQAHLQLEAEINKRTEEGMDKVTVTGRTPEDMQKEISMRTSGRIPWLLIDVPGKRPGSEVALMCVIEEMGRRLRKNNKVIGELRKSAVWEEYSQKLREKSGKIRVFCAPDVINLVDASWSLNEGIDVLIGVLEYINS